MIEKFYKPLDSRFDLLFSCFINNSGLWQNCALIMSHNKIKKTKILD